MSRNRRVTKRHSVVVTATVRFGAIIVLFSVMLILNLIASSRCTQLVAEKHALEGEIVRLEKARSREASRWESMKTPEKIEAALVRHGLRMSLPRYDQTVRMDARGRVVAGQHSVAKARQRGGDVKPASYRATRRR